MCVDDPRAVLRRGPVVRRLLADHRRRGHRPAARRRRLRRGRSSGRSRRRGSHERPSGRADPQVEIAVGGGDTARATSNWSPAPRAWCSSSTAAAAAASVRATGRSPGTCSPAGSATLLFDLLSEDEERIDEFTRELRFDIPLLTERVIGVTEWLQAAARDAGTGDRLLRSQHRRGGRPAGGRALRRPPGGREGRGVAGRPARPGHGSPAPGDGPHAADRRRRGPGGHRDEPAGLRRDSPRPRS